MSIQSATAPQIVPTINPKPVSRVSALIDSHTLKTRSSTFLPSLFFAYLPGRLEEEERAEVVELLRTVYTTKQQSPEYRLKNTIMLAQYLASKDDWHDIFAEVVATEAVQSALDSPQILAVSPKSSGKSTKQNFLTVFEALFRHALMLDCKKNFSLLVALDKKDNYKRVKKILTTIKMIKKFPGIFNLDLYQYLTNTNSDILNEKEMKTYIDLVGKFNKRDTPVVEHYMLNTGVDQALPASQAATTAAIKKHKI